MTLAVPARSGMKKNVLSFHFSFFSMRAWISSLYFAKGNVHRCVSMSKCSSLNDLFRGSWTDFSWRHRILIRGERLPSVFINSGPTCGLVTHQINPMSLHTVYALYILQSWPKFTTNLTTSSGSPSTSSKNPRLSTQGNGEIL